METRATIGHSHSIDEGASVGYEHDPSASSAVIGDDAHVRAGTIIYTDVTIGDRLTTGHHALIREDTTIGDDVLVGTGVVIDGQTEIGSNVSIQSKVYIPAKTTIGNNVFIGPNAVLTNDPYPIRKEAPMVGPTLQDGVSLGANVTILPGVTIGEDAFVAAGAVVADDVPPRTLAVGMPAEHRPLPEHLQQPNVIG